MHDLKGQRFGCLVALENVGSSKSKRRLWLCKCDCGNEKIVPSDSLINKNTKSCGCLNQKNPYLFKPKHGFCGTRLYRIWKGIKSRCKNKTSTDYKWYGAKGVKVCEDWESFENFKDWALKNGYDEKLTIDRIDPYGDYTPINCRWATVSEQNRNKRKVEN